MAMKRFILSFLLSGLFLPIASESQELEEFQKSALVRSVLPPAHGKMSRPSWVDPKSTYWALFNQKEWEQYVFDWLGRRGENFRCEKSRGSKTTDSLVGTRDCIINKRVVSVKIVIPFPNAYHAAKYDVVRTISKLRPPLLKVQREEIVKVNGSLVKIFILNKDKTSLYMDLERQAVLTLTSSQGATLKDMIALLDELSTETVNRKLTS
jgi:hypothetical protein